MRWTSLKGAAPAPERRAYPARQHPRPGAESNRFGGLHVRAPIPTGPEPPAALISFEYALRQLRGNEGIRYTFLQV